MEVDRTESEPEINFKRGNGKTTCYRCGSDGSHEMKAFVGLVQCGRTGEHLISCGTMMCFDCAQRRRDRPCLDLCDDCVSLNYLDYTEEELKREGECERANDAAVKQMEERIERMRKCKPKTVPFKVPEAITRLFFEDSSDEEE